MVEWFIKAREFANCNCDYGCPCQFNALPTTGNCEAVVAYEFYEGQYGDVSLAGTKAALVAHWPGPIHEGQGTMQVIVDEGCSEAQRDALHKILTGQDTEPMTTVWSVFSTMCETFPDLMVKAIDFSVDVDARKAKISIPNVVESTGTPILNPVTGMEHRARIDLPNGFEYHIAEVGSGDTKTGPESPITLNLESSYGQFADIHLGHQGRMN
jgi:hypothetical protein